MTVSNKKTLATLDTDELNDYLSSTYVLLLTYTSVNALYIYIYIYIYMSEFIKGYLQKFQARFHKLTLEVNKKKTVESR